MFFCFSASLVFIFHYLSETEQQTKTIIRGNDDFCLEGSEAKF